MLIFHLSFSRLMASITYCMGIYSNLRILHISFIFVSLPFWKYIYQTQIKNVKNVKTISGLQITLKLQGPCGPLTDQVLLAHTDILGPTFSIKC